MPPDLLAIGHVAKDLAPDGFTIGGAVTYATLTARAMGLRPAVVTSAGPELDLSTVLGGMPSYIVPSPVSTTFSNSYHGRRRVQLLEAVASPLTRSDIPAGWESAPLVLLAPLAGEVGNELAKGFDDGVVLASIQGWLRGWDDDGRVRAIGWDGASVLPNVDAAIVSADDLADPTQLDAWKEMVPVLIVTKGGDGASLHTGGRWHEVEPFPTREVDPTGAGDVFAAAYLVRYGETGDVLESARFASCAASFCVEAVGVDGVPSRARVEERLRSVAAFEKRR